MQEAPDKEGEPGSPAGVGSSHCLRHADTFARPAAARVAGESVARDCPLRGGLRPGPGRHSPDDPLSGMPPPPSPDVHQSLSVSVGA